MYIPPCSLLPSFLHAGFSTLVFDRPVGGFGSGSGFDSGEDAGLGDCEGGDEDVGVCEFGGLGEEGGDGTADLGEGCLGGGGEYMLVFIHMECFLFLFLLFSFSGKRISFHHGEMSCDQRGVFFLTYRSELPLALIIQRNLPILDIDATEPELKTLYFFH